MDYTKLDGGCDYCTKPCAYTMPIVHGKTMLGKQRKNKKNTLSRFSKKGNIFLLFLIDFGPFLKEQILLNIQFLVVTAHKKVI